MCNEGWWTLNYLSFPSETALTLTTIILLLFKLFWTILTHTVHERKTFRLFIFRYETLNTAETKQKQSKSLGNLIDMVSNVLS